METASWVEDNYLVGERQQFFTISSANVGYTNPNGRWSITAWIDNIESSSVIGNTYLQPLLQTVMETLRPPRTFGLRASVKL